VGHIASFDLEGRREVTTGSAVNIGAAALPLVLYKSSLQLEPTRPLYAGAASDNAGLIRVLTKCIG